jgi:hypothetical protein
MDVNCCLKGLALIERYLGSSSRIGTENDRTLSGLARARIRDSPCRTRRRLDRLSRSRYLVEKVKDATDGANRAWPPCDFRLLNFRGCDCIESGSFGPSSSVDLWILGCASPATVLSPNFTALWTLPSQ